MNKAKQFEGLNDIGLKGLNKIILACKKIAEHDNYDAAYWTKICNRAKYLKRIWRKQYGECN